MTPAQRLLSVNTRSGEEIFDLGRLHIAFRKASHSDPWQSKPWISSATGGVLQDGNHATTTEFTLWPLQIPLVEIPRTMQMFLDLQVGLSE